MNGDNDGGGGDLPAQTIKEFFKDETKEEYSRWYRTKNDELIAEHQEMQWNSSLRTRLLYTYLYSLHFHYYRTVIITSVVVLILLAVLAFLLWPQPCRRGKPGYVHIVAVDYYGLLEVERPVHCRVELTKNEVRFKLELRANCFLVLAKVALAKGRMENAFSSVQEHLLGDMMPRRRLLIMTYVQKAERGSGNCPEDQEVRIYSDKEMNKCNEWALDSICNSGMAKLDCADLVDMSKKMDKDLGKLSLLLLTQGSLQFPNYLIWQRSDRMDKKHGKYSIEHGLAQTFHMLRLWIMHQRQGNSSIMGHVEPMNEQFLIETLTNSLMPLLEIAEEMILTFVEGGIPDSG